MRPIKISSNERRHLEREERNRIRFKKIEELKSNKIEVMPFREKDGFGGSSVSALFPKDWIHLFNNALDKKIKTKVRDIKKELAFHKSLSPALQGINFFAEMHLFERMPLGVFYFTMMGTSAHETYCVKTPKGEIYFVKNPKGSNSLKKENENLLTAKMKGIKVSEHSFLDNEGRLWVKEIKDTLPLSSLALEHLGEDRRQEIIKSLATEMRLMHEKGMVHNDLYFRNILVDIGGKTSFIDLESTVFYGSKEISFHAKQSDFYKTISDALSLKLIISRKHLKLFLLSYSQYEGPQILKAITQFPPPNMSKIIRSLK